LDFWIGYEPDPKDNRLLSDGGVCPHSNVTESVEEVDVERTMTVPNVLVIVLGTCLLLINLCAYVGLWYQRGKLKTQERLVKRLFADAEVRNTQVMYVKHRNDRDETENLAAVERVRKRDNSKRTEQGNVKDRYETVRRRDKIAENMEGDECKENTWRLSRECSASTMDTHTKVRQWIEHELAHVSPNVLSLTQLEQTDQTNVSTQHTNNKLHVPVNKHSPVRLITGNHQNQNPSYSAMSKANTATVPRRKVKKMSVAVDATEILFCKPVDHISGDVGIHTSEITLHKKKAALKGAESRRGSPMPVSAHNPQGEPSVTMINSDLNAQTSSLQSNGLRCNFYKSNSDTEPQTSALLPKDEQLSRNVTDHTCLDCEAAVPIMNPGMTSKYMHTSPVKFKLHAPKVHTGVTTSSNLHHAENICLTSRDIATNTSEKLRLVDPLKNIHIRNSPEILSPEHNIATQVEEESYARELASIRTVAAKRLSLPSDGIWPPASRGESTKRKHNQKETKIRSRKNNFPFVSGWRIPSDTGRKQRNTGSLFKLKKLEPLKESVCASRPTVAASNNTAIACIEEHQTTLAPVHQEEHIPSPACTSIVVHEHTLEKQNRIRQHLPSTASSPIKPRTGEAVGVKSPLPDTFTRKQRAPPKVSVGTSTSSLIMSEGTSIGTVRRMKNNGNQKYRGKREDSKPEEG
jgi:hypothetical protein